MVEVEAIRVNSHAILFNEIDLLSATELAPAMARLMTHQACIETVLAEALVLVWRAVVVKPQALRSVPWLAKEAAAWNY